MSLCQRGSHYCVRTRLCPSLHDAAKGQTLAERDSSKNEWAWDSCQKSLPSTKTGPTEVMAWRGVVWQQETVPRYGRKKQSNKKERGTFSAETGCPKSHAFSLFSIPASPFNRTLSNEKHRRSLARISWAHHQRFISSSSYVYTLSSLTTSLRPDIIATK